MNKALAILYKYPQANPVDGFRIADDGTGAQVIEVWAVQDDQGNPVPMPTEDDLAAWWAEYSTWRESTKYREQRRKEYPPITEQLDAIWKSWHPPAGSPAQAMKERIMAVKSKYRKPA